MMAVTLATVVPAMVAIMRGCLVGRLRLGGARTILWSRLHSGSFVYGYKKRRRCRQQEISDDTFQSNSPERNPLRDY